MLESTLHVFSMHAGDTLQGTLTCISTGRIPRFCNLESSSDASSDSSGVSMSNMLCSARHSPISMRSLLSLMSWSSSSTTCEGCVPCSWARSNS